MIGRPTIFLLSPATMSGVRAKQLLSPRARFEAATLLRSADGVPISDAFTFMSALYFRGKIAYARRFALAPATLGSEAIYVIAPGFGLVRPDWRMTLKTAAKMARTAVDPRKRSYRKPLQDAAKAVAAQIGADARVVLLGSIATGKYVDVLWPIFGERLMFPIDFVGLGDMSRGSILLKAAASGIELNYSGLDVERHRPRKRADDTAGEPHADA